MTFLTALGFIALGAVRLALFFIIVCAALTLIAVIANFVVMPIVNRTPDRIKAAWSLFWTGLLIVFGVLFFGVILFQIGVGES